ncbi:hypothetical protein FY528_15955 [Hymenobacter lutimineralis]|uniref:Uncharacterized protein n=1 Tax=Hymenobacter lutimineralis TaxID=2606448 RepID=A0A5D6UWN4_9BACT|nr:hypothetical protein [Hymenobacter lutimineralis]TYZ07308.1 hypothetical protein FY528_15955 [Hymenobacter lutimineralis]
MRYVDLNRLVIPAGWQSKANNTLADLQIKTQEERRIFFKNLTNPLWKRPDFVRAILPLGSTLFRKCWYSESRITDDIDIDHFRPKGKDANKSFKTQFQEYLSENEFEQLEEESTRGWWFLAFESKNFRVCSCFRNQSRHDTSIALANLKNRAKGKSDFFPLKKGSSVAINADGIENEINCLLDPCKLGDAEFISFDQFGNAYTIYDDSTEERKWIKCRVLTSIAVYHLDEHDLIEFRKKKWKYCKDFIYDKMKKALFVDKDIDEVRRLKQEFITEFLDANHEFSAVAIDCIRYYKDEENWLERVFPKNTLSK